MYLSSGFSERLRFLLLPDKTVVLQISSTLFRDDPDSFEWSNTFLLPTNENPNPAWYPTLVVAVNPTNKHWNSENTFEGDDLKNLHLLWQDNIGPTIKSRVELYGVIGLAANHF